MMQKLKLFCSNANRMKCLARFFSILLLMGSAANATPLASEKFAGKEAMIYADTLDQCQDSHAE